MDTNTELKRRVEGYKALAQQFLDGDKRIFIKDINNHYYFAYVVFVGEEQITIQCFGPEDRKDKKFSLYWFTISIFDEYKEEK